MLYLLDTCIFSYLEDPESPYNEHVLSVLRSLTDEDDVCLSILSIYELEYGLKNAEDLAPELRRAKRHALTFYRILPLSREGAAIFAELKSRYREQMAQEMAAKGLAKHLARHTVDFMIASTALEYAGAVVSNDRIFTALRDLFPALSVADWTVA